MAGPVQVQPGGTLALKVVTLNKEGEVINVALPPDVAVQMSKTDDSVTAVDPATGNFTFTAGASEGDDSLSETGGGLASTAYPVQVIDLVPAALAIQTQ